MRRFKDGVNPKYKKTVKIKRHYVILKNQIGVLYNLNIHKGKPYASSSFVPALFESKKLAQGAFSCMQFRDHYKAIYKTLFFEGRSLQ